MAFLPVALKVNGGKRVGASVKIEDDWGGEVSISIDYGMLEIREA